MESMSFCCGNTDHAMCLNNFAIETIAQDRNFIFTIEMVTNTVDYPRMDTISIEIN